MKDLLSTRNLVHPLSNRGFQSPFWTSEIPSTLDNVTFIVKNSWHTDKGYADYFTRIVEDFMHIKYPSTLLYRHHYKMLGGFDLQFGHESAKNDSLRFELNPNKVDKEILFDFITKILDKKDFQSLHFTRLDFAFDYFIPVSLPLFFDNQKRKYSIFGSSGNGIETLYLGGSGSRVQIRIYNKLIELLSALNSENSGEGFSFTPDMYDLPCFRIEAQIRHSLQPFESLFFNPFSGLRYCDLLSSGSSYDVIANSYIAQHGFTAFLSELSQSGKKRYKKKLRLNTDLVPPEYLFSERAQKIFDSFSKLIFDNLGH